MFWKKQKGIDEKVAEQQKERTSPTQEEPEATVSTSQALAYVIGVSIAGYILGGSLNSLIGVYTGNDVRTFQTKSGFYQVIRKQTGLCESETVSRLFGPQYTLKMVRTTKESGCFSEKSESYYDITPGLNNSRNGIVDLIETENGTDINLKARCGPRDEQCDLRFRQADKDFQRIYEKNYTKLEENLECQKRENDSGKNTQI
jgi:hypothetical protein